MANTYRLLEERFDIMNKEDFDRMTSHFDRQEKMLGKVTEEMRAAKSVSGRTAAWSSAATSHHRDRRRTRHQHSQEYKGRFSRSNEERNSSSAGLNDGPMSLTSFGMITEPPAPETFFGDALTNNGAEAPKSHLPPMEVRMLSSAAGGLLHRFSLYGDEDFIFPTASFLDPR